MIQISAVILTKNSEHYLQKVLESLQELDEVVVLDNGSEDSTLSIATQFQNVNIHQHPFIGFGKMKQLGASLAKNDWILSIDSDEIASNALIAELRHTHLEPHIAYSYEVKNFYQGQWVRCCGWDKDRCVGIYHRKYARFDDSEVHEKIISLQGKLQTKPLQGFIEHYPFENATEFLVKIKRYGELFAKQHIHHKYSSPIKAVTRSVWCFFKNYFLQRGFLHGYVGFVISSYNAQSVFWKYIILYELQQKTKS
ncbi:glycosyl transferase [Helicobacter monodelphidis]|uniref:glycosyltransferase family 2 protein n=1 Tax=Helicobacter sp. 15-1451 TaxID=2004995 RepID=UPI000DCB9D7B|nr:glycosyltransferase family 2 protein [Helicobacter sp. 15-1451]RAX57602.1 glycosyl transferase [Helicobacter sp. 15-1451]